MRRPRRPRRGLSPRADDLFAIARDELQGLVMVQWLHGLHELVDAVEPGSANSFQRTSVWRVEDKPRPLPGRRRHAGLPFSHQPIPVSRQQMVGSLPPAPGENTARRCKGPRRPEAPRERDQRVRPLERLTVLEEDEAVRVFEVQPILSCQYIAKRRLKGGEPQLAFPVQPDSGRDGPGTQIANAVEEHQPIRARVVHAAIRALNTPSGSRAARDGWMKK